MRTFIALAVLILSISGVSAIEFSNITAASSPPGPNTKFAGTPGTGAYLYSLTNIAQAFPGYTNILMHARINPAMRMAAARPIPSGVYLPFAFAEADVTNWGYYLLTNHLTDYGFVNVFINNNWCSNRLDANGVPIPRLDYYPNGLTNTIRILKSMGETLCLYGSVNPNGLYFTNQPSYPNLSYSDRHPTIWATNAYACGKLWGSWGVRAIWLDPGVVIGQNLPYMAVNENQYALEALAVGFDEGAALAFQHPVSIGADSMTEINATTTPNSLYPFTNNYILGVQNGFDSHDQGDLIGNVSQIQRQFQSAVRNSPIVTSAYGGPVVSHIPTYDSYRGYYSGATGWATTNHTRFAFYLDCLLSSWPIFGADNAFLGPNAAELVVFKNRAAIAICNDPVFSQVYDIPIVPTNNSQKAYSRQLANGDVALCLWNLNTNATTDFNVRLLDIPGIWTNKVKVLDIGDGVITNFNDYAVTTVNTGGCNFYRLYAGPISELAASASASPPVIYSNLLDIVTPTLWLEPDDALAQGKVTNDVACMMPDRYSGYDFTSATEPTYLTNVVHGHGAWYFTNSAYGNAVTYIATPTNYSLLVVYKTTVQADEQYVWELGSHNYNISSSSLNTPPYVRSTFAGSDIQLTVSVPRNGWVYAVTVKKGNTLYLRANGSPMVSLTRDYNWPVTSPMYVGGNVAENNHYFFGYIAELVYVENDITFDQADQLSAYAKWKYGL